MDKKVLKEYADLMVTIKLLEEKKEGLQNTIIDMMEADGRKDYTSTYGKFEISGRRTYEYSENIKKMQDEVYKAKKQEEANGTAELTRHSTFIRFSSNK